jgi:O-antigen/teichoic acid export membrane protein
LKKNDLIQEAAKLSMAKTIGFVLKFLSGVLLARWLGPEGRGLYALLMVVPMIVISLVEFGMRRSAIHHISKKDFPVEKVIGVLLIVFLFSSFFGTIISIIIYQRMDNPDMDIPLIILASFSIPVTLLIRMSRSILVGQQLYKKNNLLLILPNLINILALAGFVYFGKMDVFGALLSILISNLILASYVFRNVIHSNSIKLKFDKTIFLSLIKLGATYAIAMLLVRLNYRVDIILLEYLSNIKEVGYYSLGATLAEQWQTPFAIGAVIISKTAAAEDFLKLKPKVLQTARVNFLLSLLAFVAIYFLAPFFVPLIYGERFSDSIQIIQYILPGVVFLITAKVFGTSLAGMMKTKYVIWIFLIALLCNIGLNFLFHPETWRFRSSYFYKHQLCFWNSWSDRGFLCFNKNRS